MKRSQVLEIKNLRLAGTSIEEIAEKIGKRPSTVQRWIRELRKAGHKIPKQKPGRKKLDLTKLD